MLSESLWQTELKTHLHKAGIDCHFTRRNGVLHIALKGVNLPPASAMVPEIMRYFHQQTPLGLGETNSVKIYGQTPDDPFPVWEYESQMGGVFPSLPPEPSLEKQPLWQRVQQGDSTAIQTALERAFSPKKMRVNVHPIKVGFRIELVADQLPPQGILVKLVDQELRRYQMPLATPLQLIAQDGNKTWETEFRLGHLPPPPAAVQLQEPSPKISIPNPQTTLTFPVYSLDPTGKTILLVGVTTGFVLSLIPGIRFILSYLVIIIHELGHTVAAWLMGYPAIPAFDLVYGGGITWQLSQRWALIPLVMYGGLGWLIYHFRRNRLTVITLAVLGFVYMVIYFTRFSQLLMIAMGHGLELVFMGIFLYRALTGWAGQQPGERSLYGILGFFILFYNLNFTRQLLFDPVMRELYFMGKGEVLDHDFVRIAREFLPVNLSLVVVLFGLSCLLTPLVTWGLYRYQNYWRYGWVQLLRR